MLERDALFWKSDFRETPAKEMGEFPQAAHTAARKSWRRDDEGVFSVDLKNEEALAVETPTYWKDFSSRTGTTRRHRQMW
jgi:hypothetical protein